MKGYSFGELVKLAEAALPKTDNAVSATKLQTARTIGGVAFDGTGNINLPGVNIAGTQNTSGRAAVASTADKLTTARNINGVAFDGTKNIDISAGAVGTYTKAEIDSKDNAKLNLTGGTLTGTLNGVAANFSGSLVLSEDNAAPLSLNRGSQVGIAFQVGTSTTRYVGVDVNGGLRFGSDLNHSKNSLVYHTGNKPTATDVGALASNGTAVAATKLATPRSINGVNFDGTTNITVADNTKVPTTRKVNNKALSGDISLTASDVGALATSGGALTGNLTISKSEAVINISSTADVEHKMSRIEFRNPAKQDVQIRHNAHDSTRAPFGLHIERTSDSAQPTQKTYLQVEGEIYADGTQRVYHVGNKPTAADVGALAVGGTANRSNGVVATHASWNTQTNDFLTGSASSPDGSGLTSYVDWIQWGHNGGSKYRHTIYSFADTTSMKQLWYAAKNNTTASGTPDRYQIFHTGTPPNADQVGTYTKAEIDSKDNTKLNLSGGTMTGHLAIKSSASSFQGMNIESTAAGWSYLQLKATTGTAHIAVNTNAIDGGTAGALHLRPAGQKNGSLIIQNNAVMRHQTATGYWEVGSQNSSHCHYNTDRPNHWFNKEVKVNGEIYCGASYAQRVYHQGFKPTAADVGALASNGTAVAATKLATPRAINGVNFDGSANITITAAANGGTSAACSGNAATATTLQTARTIGGVSFNGSANINPHTLAVSESSSSSYYPILWESGGRVYKCASNKGRIRASDGTLDIGAVAASGMISTSAHFSGNGSGLTNIPRSAVNSTYVTLYDNPAGLNTGNFVLSQPYTDFKEILFITSDDAGIYRYALSRTREEIDILQTYNAYWAIMAEANNYWNGTFNMSDKKTFVTYKETGRVYRVVGIR